jgi:hypothetical protein
MEKEYVRSVIILIGGARLPDESMKQYLARVSLYTGIGYRPLRDAYYGQEIRPGVLISEQTKQKLEEAAQHARRPHEIIAYTEHQLAVWEADPARHRAWIDAARDFLAQLRRYHEGPGGGDSLARADDVRGRCGGSGRTAAAAALAAATAAKT